MRNSPVHTPPGRRQTAIGDRPEGPSRINRYTAGFARVDTSRHDDREPISPPEPACTVLPARTPPDVPARPRRLQPLLSRTYPYRPVLIMTPKGISMRFHPSSRFMIVKEDLDPIRSSSLLEDWAVTYRPMSCSISFHHSPVPPQAVDPSSSHLARSECP